jgi:hypothetical protein
LSLGGEVRLQGEYTRHPDFGFDFAEDEALLSRVLAHADLHLSDAVRFFVQLGSHLTEGRAGGDSPTDEDGLDLTQGFVDLTSTVGGAGATLRIGRQELAFGSGRLISVRESPNIRRTFNGARSFVRAGSLNIDALLVRPTSIKRGVFDDGIDDEQWLYGIYATAPITAVSGLSVDFYYLGYERDQARFVQGTADEKRHSVGMRLFGKRGGADWDIEAAYQFGSFGSADISAWTVATAAGFTFERLPLKPRLGLKADIASGDKDPSDGSLQTFNPLYPKLPYFTEAGLVAPANIMDVHPTLDITPAPGLTISTGANLLWRHRRADAFYAPPLVAVPGLSGRGRYIGTQFEAGAEWQASRYIEMKLSYVHFIPGSPIEQIGARNVDFVRGSIAFRF